MHKDRNVQTSIRKNSDKKLQKKIKLNKYGNTKLLRNNKNQKHMVFIHKLNLNDIGEETVFEKDTSNDPLWADATGLYGCSMCNATHFVPF